jgi:hypothetical protein
VRQPLKIDRLPLDFHDRIRASRAKGWAWEEIERDSPSWPEWEKADAAALALFPGKRLPRPHLQRWYDLRVEQTLQEQAQRVIAAHAAADQCALRGFENLHASVKHALAETVFAIVDARQHPEKIAAALTALGRLMAQFDRNELKRKEVERETHKFELWAISRGRDLEEATPKKELTPEFQGPTSGNG